MRRDRLKELIATRHRVIGAVVNSRERGLVDAIAHAGFDYVQFDAEHGAIDLGTLEEMIARADAVDLPAIVRVPRNAPDAIQVVLDAGAVGVQVPQVNTVAQARAAVSAAHFHPLGARGLATARAGRFGIGATLVDHVERAERTTVVIPQLEDRSALDDLDALVATPGVDLWFVGPSDLSQSFGHPGRADAPEVQDAMDRMIAACHRADVPVATSVSSLATAQSAFARGYDIVSIVALGLFGAAATSFLETLREPGKASA
jgi:4-hydroxy-2-oxoheptanedioate aldolase